MLRIGHGRKVNACLIWLREVVFLVERGGSRVRNRGDAEILFRFAGTRLRQELTGHFTLVEGVTIWRMDFTGVYQGKL